MLTSSDYKKILEFSMFINQNYDNFVNNVLLSLSNLFGYRLTVYTIFSENTEQEIYVESVQSLNMSLVGTLAYKQSLYKSDLFIHRVRILRTNNAQKDYYLIEDVATREEFFATDYGKHLKSLYLGYQAAFTPASSREHPLHALNIYRSEIEGDFTPKEKLLLSEISKVLEFSVILYKNRMKTRSIVSLLDWQSEIKGYGVAVFGEKKEVVHSTPLFRAYVTNLTGAPNFIDASEILINEIITGNSSQSDESMSPFSALIKDYYISADSSMRFNGECWRKYLLVSIGKNEEPVDSKTSASFKTGFIDTFSFTAREKEIAFLITLGASNPDISRRLFINESTVKFHMKNIYRKLGVRSRTQALLKLMDENDET